MLHLHTCPCQKKKTCKSTSLHRRTNSAASWGITTVVLCPHASTVSKRVFTFHGNVEMHKQLGSLKNTPWKWPAELVCSQKVGQNYKPAQKLEKKGKPGWQLFTRFTEVSCKRGLISLPQWGLECTGHVPSFLSRFTCILNEKSGLESATSSLALCCSPNCWCWLRRHTGKSAGLNLADC